jgi:hypothetical protein
MKLFDDIANKLLEDETFQEGLVGRIISRIRKTEEAEFVPQSTFTLLKDKQGRTRILGIYSNKFEDLEDDIIAEAGHKEFATWASENKFKPVVTMYHLPQMPGGFWAQVFEEHGEDVQKLNEIIQIVYADFALADVEEDARPGHESWFCF